MAELQERAVSKVVVDRSRCFSHERCTLIAPRVFSIDDEGISTVGDISLTDDETLLEAARACPVQAIFVFGADGKPLFPEAVTW